MGAIVTNEDVSLFMSSPVVTATYDHNNDGTIDSASLDLIVATSEGLFLATIRGIYELPLVAPIDPFAKHVVLQIVHCQSIKLFPELFRSGTTVCEDVGKLLEQIRNGELKLDHPLLPASQALSAPTAYSLPGRGYEAVEGRRRDD